MHSLQRSERLVMTCREAVGQDGAGRAVDADAGQRSHGRAQRLQRRVERQAQPATNFLHSARKIEHVFSSPYASSDCQKGQHGTAHLLKHVMRMFMRIQHLNNQCYAQDKRMQNVLTVHAPAA